MPPSATTQGRLGTDRPSKDPAWRSSEGSSDPGRPWGLPADGLQLREVQAEKRDGAVPGECRGGRVVEVGPGLVEERVLRAWIDVDLGVAHPFEPSLHVGGLAVQLCSSCSATCTKIGLAMSRSPDFGQM